LSFNLFQKYHYEVDSPFHILHLVIVSAGEISIEFQKMGITTLLWSNSVHYRSDHGFLFSPDYNFSDVFEPIFLKLFHTTWLY